LDGVRGKFIMAAGIDSLQKQYSGQENM